MSRYGIFEAKNRLSELAERARSGERIEITRHGVVVAHLVPPDAVNRGAAHADLVARIKRSRKGLSLGGTTIKALIEEGRR